MRRFVKWTFRNLKGFRGLMTAMIVGGIAGWIAAPVVGLPAFAGAFGIMAFVGLVFTVTHRTPPAE